MLDCKCGPVEHVDKGGYILLHEDVKQVCLICDNPSYFTSFTGCMNLHSFEEEFDVEAVRDCTNIGCLLKKTISFFIFSSSFTITCISFLQNFKDCTAWSLIGWGRFWNFW